MGRVEARPASRRRAWIAGLAAATWILATPALNYALVDLWPSHFYGWSLFPWMVLFLRRVLDDTGPTQPWRKALALGLVLGLFGVNGHFGQVPILVLPMALMCACEPRGTFRRLPALLAAAAIGTCIAAPSVVRLMQEIRLFPDVARNTVEVPVGARELVGLVLRPLIDLRSDGSLELGEYSAQTALLRRSDVPAGAGRNGRRPRQAPAITREWRRRSWARSSCCSGPSYSIAS